MRARLIVLAAIALLAAMLPQTVLGAAAGQQAPEGGLAFLAAGVFAVWAVFFAYALYLGRKNAALRRELDDLRRSVGDKPPR